MLELYNSKYKEISIHHLLKVFFDYKLSIFAVVFLSTAISVYIAYSIKPIYQSEALIKIGKYYKLKRGGDIEPRPIDSSKELTQELSFNFIERGDKNSFISKVEHKKGVDNYISVISVSNSIDGAENLIKDVEQYIVSIHELFVKQHTEQYKIELKNITNKISVITTKQKFFLTKNSYDNKDYSSLLNTLQLMSIINTDLGVGYIGKIIERKEKLELLIKKPYMSKSKIVGSIKSNVTPISPKKRVIIFTGFFIGLLLSLFIIFTKEIFKIKNKLI
jgi:LPS O-antigen subunit length determinant protein (WzzB/FepE family)